MQIFADLQLHSRFSRAVSSQMTLPNIAAWAAKKGIGLIATGDWTHPMWFREIVRELEETGNGLLKLRTQNSEPNDKQNPLFLLATEVSCMYTQGGKGRRVHTLIWVPTIASAEKINKEMTRQGCNLLSDGRPIIGLTSIQVAELVLTIEPKALIIPAHCLVPESMVLTDGFFPKQIQHITKGEKVYTHSGRFQKVTEVKKRPYSGDIVTIKPWYFRPGLTTTPEHPYWAIETLKKCSTGDICRPSKAHLRVCREKVCLLYKPTWILAKNLQIGDVLVYPRPRKLKVSTKTFLSHDLRHLSPKNGMVSAGGTRGRSVPDTLKITKDFGRLIGYYVAEGTTDGKNSFSFTFSSDEKVYIDDLIDLVKTVFGLGKPRIYRRDGTKGVEIGFSSKIHAAWLATVCYQNVTKRNAASKKLPGFLFKAEPRVQAEFLRGWYRGDKGYTSSRSLMNHIKTLCLQLGIIPSVVVDTADAHAKRGNHQFGNRVVRARSDSFAFSNFAFFDDVYDLRNEIKRSQTKIDRRHGWIDQKNIYLPIKNIEHDQYKGEVYNLEVENDHSYVAEFAAVHNCWTPWFSLYGSKSGFDTIDEAFGPFAKNIYAVETGLSSNPSMNWRIKELDNRAILSFSDAHSGPKLGREATVFDIKNFSYEEIYDAIRMQKNIAYTIEFYPEEGKYHYSGHKNCGVRCTPDETKKNGMTCPVCGKPLVEGVMQRVDQLASRSEAELELSNNPIIPALPAGRQLSNVKAKMTWSKTFPKRPPFVMTVPLQEIISEAIGSPVASPKVAFAYDRLITALKNEFFILLEASISDISHIAGERVAQAIDKVRRGDIVIEPGYDGVFGVVNIWGDGTRQDSTKEQLEIFS